MSNESPVEIRAESMNSVLSEVESVVRNFNGDAVLANEIEDNVVETPGSLSDSSVKKKKKRKDTSEASQDEMDQDAHLLGRGNSFRALRQHTRIMSYDETLIDDMIEQQLGGNLSSGPRGRKKKALDMDKEVDVEAMIAVSIGFPRDALTEEEINAGVVTKLGGEDQANYIVVRNHILTRWRENVNVWLHQATVMESIRTQFKDLVASSYKFLLSHGYINFGVAPAIKAAIPADSSKSAVVIIGAGLAGLAAARQLLSFGHKVVVVEGRQRPGGRVYTKKMEGGGKMAAADLGGSVVTGIHGNPLGVLARQLGFPLHKIREKCPIYQSDGLPVEEEMDLKVEAQFNKLLDLASSWREEMESVADSIALGTTLETLREQASVAVTAEERRLFDWHLANLEYANAGLLSKLSLAFWDQDDPYEMGGDHCFVAGGNVRLISALAEDIPIFYGKSVHTIRYGSSGVKVITGDQVFEGDIALCTVPLGLLKRKAIRFEPELPKRKTDAIGRLGFGLLNKVAMLFPNIFWGAELDTFGHLANHSSRRGEFFLFYSYAAVSGGPLLIALVAGEAAINFERMPPLQAIQRVLSILRAIYQPRGISVPDPIQTVCTRWGSDPLCYGSYSNVAVGASGDDYDILAESVGGQLHFAGEATNRQYPATMHGAFLSGLREAGKIAAQAAASIAPPKLVKDIQLHEISLADLFREPDLEFGNFSVVYDPQSEDPQSFAILRLLIKENFKKKDVDGQGIEPHKHHFQQMQQQQQQLHLYTIVTRGQVLELREVRGGDSVRLLFLCEKFGVKLAGRRGLGVEGDAIMAAVKLARASRKTASSVYVPTTVSEIKVQTVNAGT